MKPSKDSTLPKHIAIIVDGNRRWAEKRGLSNVAGHKKAANEVIKDLIYHSIELKIPYITFWCWSTENWKRGKRFASILFNILRLGLERNTEKYIRDGIKLNTIGDLSKLPKNMVKTIENLKKKSRNNKKITITMALNYGGRDEIIRAIKRGKSEIRNPKSEITEEKFEKYLDTTGMPDPDLIIRTGGAKRLSGFMLWQCQYAELYFTKTYFPDFTSKEFDKALKDFKGRQRRYGK